MSAEQDRAPVSSEVSHANSEPGQTAQHPPAHQPPDSFWARVKRHKVVEWTLAYVAFGYAFLHTVEMLGEAFEWPLLVPRLTVFGLVLGAPIAVTLAWYHGHRARRRVSGPELSILIVLLLVAGSVMWWLSRNGHERGVTSTSSAAANTTVAPAPLRASFKPPLHSIAVLPFVNISGDKEQEYFSEGLTEELLNSLARINELQVAARTSSFSFQGEHPDIATVAHKLNVGAVLEGSVRRSAHTVRVSAQLIDGVTGFHIWSQTYDRDLGDVLALQSDIASAVAAALKVTLLGGTVAKFDLGGTRNPAAFDAYLKGLQAFRASHKAKDAEAAIAAYSNAIQLDPNFALAYVGRSRAFDELASWWTEGIEAASEPYAKARLDAHKAIALAPHLGEAHLVLANSLAEQLDFTRASEEYERALALTPGSALVLQDYGLFAVLMGRTEQGLLASRRAVLLDPLNRKTHLNLMDALINARRPEEAIAALHDALALDPTYAVAQWVPYYVLGNYQSARTMCESTPGSSDTYECLAMIYDKLGRRTDAEGALKKFKAVDPDNWYAFADVFAQWGDTAEALTSLEAALRIRHVALEYLKTWPLNDPLRKEPRFQAIERELNFPN